MNWYKVFYWLTVADNVKTVTGILSIVFGVYFIGATAAALGIFESVYSTWEKGTKKVYLLFSTFFIISIFLWMLMPTKKDSLIIVAGGAVGNFITTDTSARAIPAEAMSLLRAKMIEWKATTLDEVKDTLVNKTKEELIEMYKNKK